MSNGALSQVTLSRDIYQAFIFPAPFEKSKRSKDSPESPGRAVFFFVETLSGYVPPETKSWFLRQSDGRTDKGDTVNWGDLNVCVLAESSHLHNVVGTAWLPMRRTAARVKLRLARK